MVELSFELSGAEAEWKIKKQEHLQSSYPQQNGGDERLIKGGRRGTELHRNLEEKKSPLLVQKECTRGKKKGKGNIDRLYRKGNQKELDDGGEEKGWLCLTRCSDSLGWGSAC